MADERLDEQQQRTRLLRQGEDARRSRKIAADLRLQQMERQAQVAQEEAPVTETLAGEQCYAELPRHSHTGVR